MLHAISSNYLSATASSSSNSFNTTLGGLNPAADTSGNGKLEDGEPSYYLTADSYASLNNIFQQISSSIQTGSSSVTLDETTVVRDVVTPYFEIPHVVTNGVADYTAAEITIQTAEHIDDNSDGTPIFGTPVDVDLDYEIVGNQLDVTGFDFAENAVMTLTNNNQTTHEGKKLIITFKIKPVDGFIGGNGVFTNDKTSGVYQPDGNGGLTAVENFPVPDVNVAFKAIHIQKEEQYIYLGNHANLDSLLTSFGITYTFEAGEGTPYTVNGYNNGYVMLRYKLKDNDSDAYMYYTIMPGRDAGTWTYVNGNGHVSDTAGTDIRPWIEDDHTYNISYEVFAKEKVNEDGTVMTDSTGKVYEPETTGALEATVYVFKPEVTFQDSKYKYMEQLAAMAAADHYNAVNWLGDTQVLWKNSNFTWDLDHRPAGVMPSGPRPELTFEFDIDLESWINSANEVYTTNCVPVNVTNVTAKSSHAPDGRVVTAGTTSYRDEIECDCEHNAETVVAPATLPATKVGDNSIEEFVIHVYDVHGKLAISKMVKNDSSTLYAVDAKQMFTFTVTLKNGTTPVAGTYKCILPDGSTGTVTFNNEGVATVKLQHGQTITIEGITNGMSYKVEEAPVAGFTTTATVNDESVTSAEGNIVANATQNVAFTNTYNVGQLTVKKTIRDISGMYDLSGDAFSFTVTFSGTTTPIGYTVNGTQGTTTNGAATFTLTKDQTATFDRIPAGVAYTVTENTNFPMAGYTKGTETNTSGTIAKNRISAAVVENIYNTGTLTISKTGMDAGEYAVFNATVVARGVEQTIKVVVPNGDSAVIKGLDLGSAYKVTEVGDWTWRYTSKVTSDSGNGTIPTGSDYKASVMFENTKDKKQWIDGSTYAENVFGDAGDSNAKVERK